jgi:hypothetical protein
VRGIRCNPESRQFYDRRRADGERHTQAELALARRRINVVWVLLRDGHCYDPVHAECRRLEDRLD